MKLYLTLPETVRLPCAKTFAVGEQSDTRQKHRLPDVLTHGKENAYGKFDTFVVCLTYDTRQKRCLVMSM